MRGAKAVVECLKEQGVDTIFGYPGGMNLPLYDALYDERNIRQIVTSHAQRTPPMAMRVRRARSASVLRHRGLARRIS